VVRRVHRRLAAMLVGGSTTFLWQVVHLGRLRADDHVDYRFENYAEERDRIQVFTQSALFEKSLGAGVTAHGEYVYDSISGATPTGGPPPPGSNQVPLTTMHDIRNAFNLGADIPWGINQITPQFAYSTESDYQSIGVSLTDALELNQKNTVLTLGVSHDFDQVQPKFWPTAKDKDTTDVLLGVTQILGPGTLLSANLTLGVANGFLADPYRGFRFEDYPDPTGLFPEQRPDHRTKEVVLVTLTQHVDPLDASAELSYRFYHDSFAITAQTVALHWYQNVGKHLVVAPTFRYYYQTAASFYSTELPGDPTDPFSTVPIPSYYSADYRLSQMETFSYGLTVTAKLGSHVFLDAGYMRYDMRGLDGVTSQSAYPDANVITVGARIWF
jgi:hypothetical protein